MVRDFAAFSGSEMGDARLMDRAVRLAASRARPRRIVDLGVGDGAFLLDWVRRMPSLAPGIEVLLVDRTDGVDAGILTALCARGFRPRSAQADGLDWLRVQPAEAATWVLANLFLHHFTAESLRAMFNALAEKAELFCACEPRRLVQPSFPGPTHLIATHPITFAGGGLAGLTLGVALRQRDVPVTLWSYPRHRVCGEFICGRGHSGTSVTQGRRRDNRIDGLLSRPNQFIHGSSVVCHESRALADARGSFPNRAATVRERGTANLWMHRLIAETAEIIAEIIVDKSRKDDINTSSINHK